MQHMHRAPPRFARITRLSHALGSLREWPLTSDPALASLRRATRSVAAAILGVLSTYVATHAVSTNASLGPALLAGIVGMTASFSINDPTPASQVITMLLFPVVSATAVFLGALLAPNLLLADTALLIIIFLAFALRRVSPRFQPLGITAFLSFYFASLLHSTIQQMPFLLIAIALGVGWSVAALFVVLPERPEAARARSIDTFYTDAATIHAVRHLLIAPPSSGWLVRPPGTRVALDRLTGVATDLQNQLADAEANGTSTTYTRALAYFLADVVISLETITESTGRLVALPALDPPLRAALLDLLRRLERAFRARTVRGQHSAVASARCALEDACARLSALSAAGAAVTPDAAVQQRLARRVEHAVRWLLDNPTDEDLAREEAARRLSPALSGTGSGPVSSISSNRHNNPAASLTKRPDPTTILAIQGVLAGALSIVVGYLLSPTNQYWTLLAAFVVLSRPGSIGVTYARAVHRVLGTLAGAFIGFGLARLVAGFPLAEIALAFASVFAAYYLFNVSYAMMTFFITIMLAMLYDILLGSVSVQLLQARFVDTLFGAAIGLLITLLVFPNKTGDEVKRNLKSYFTLLDAYIQRCLDALLASGCMPPAIAETIALNAAAQAARNSLHTLRRLPGAHSRAGADQSMAALNATSYNARHLTDPIGRRAPMTLDPSAASILAPLRKSVAANLHALCALLSGAHDQTVSCREALDVDPSAARAKRRAHAVRGICRRHSRTTRHSPLVARIPYARRCPASTRQILPLAH